MQQLENRNATSKKVRSVVSIAAAVVGAVVLCQPDLAHARGGHGGGGHGGFHGGGFHGHVAAVHHVGGFHGRVAAVHHNFSDVHSRQQVRVANHSVDVHRRSVDVHRSFADNRGRHWYHGWHNGRFGWWLAGAGLAWTYYTQPWDAYCSSPAGYYPNVTQCNTTWQMGSAS
jgi:hypothetical protein